MGGNVFKETYEVVRLNAEQYKHVSSEFFKEFHDFLSNNEYESYEDSYVEWEEIPSYRKKDSFGDMDVIYQNQYSSDNIIGFLVSKIGIPKDKISRNSNVVSFLYNPFDYGDFQVDLIYIDSEFYQSSLDYYSYNDLGNLRGRIAHSLGMKLGHEGLSYIHRDGDQVCFELCLSRDKIAIDKFLGFQNVENFWETGPETLEDIFRYIASSEYFNPDIYLLHNRNHQSRVRDKKRKTYTDFLLWCETLPISDYFPRLDNKGFYQLKAIEHFNKKFLLELHIAKHEENKRFKQKFNGELVMGVTGVSGKALGELMSRLKDAIPRELILSLESETIGVIVGDLYKKWK